MGIRALEEEGMGESTISFTYIHLFNTNFIESLCFKMALGIIIQIHTNNKSPILTLHTI